MDFGNEDDGYEFSDGIGTNPFGLFGSITGNPSPDYSDEAELAMKLIQAGEAFSEFVDYAKEHDIELDELDQMSLMRMGVDERIVMYGFLASSSGLGRIEEISDSDDDNPFRVDDDDPFR